MVFFCLPYSQIRLDYIAVSLKHSLSEAEYDSGLFVSSHILQVAGAALTGGAQTLSVQALLSWSSF